MPGFLQRKTRFVFACAAVLLAGQRGFLKAEEAAHAVSTNSAIEQFKRFLSSPPVIENLVFSERLPPDPKAPWRTDLPLDSSTAFRHYHARWQSNAFLLREIERPEAQNDLKATGLVAAHYEDECWFRYSQETHAGRIDFGLSPTNTVCKTAYNNGYLLRQALSLGVMHTEVGSLIWNGNQFRSVKAARQTKVIGTLNVGAARLVESLSVRYTNEKGDVYWRIRYDYEADPIAGFIPRRISCFWLNDETEVKRAEFLIHELRIANDLLRRDAFYLSDVAKSNLFHVNVFTNGGVFARGPNGELSLIATLDANAPSIRGLPSRAELAVTYSLWGCLNATFLILVARMRLQRRNQHGNMKL